MTFVQRGQSLIDHIVILLVTAIFVIVLLTVVSNALQAQKPSAFPVSAATLVESCGSTSAVSTRNFKTEDFLNCLYDAGITLAYNGDPVKRTALP